MEFGDMLIVKEKICWHLCCDCNWNSYHCSGRRTVWVSQSPPISSHGPCGGGKGAQTQREPGTSGGLCSQLTCSQEYAAFVALHPCLLPGARRGKPQGAGALFHRASTSLLADARFIHGAINCLHFPVSWALPRASRCFYCSYQTEDYLDLID